MSATKFHAAFFSAWLAMALVVAIKTALLGNEQSSLAKQRGSDLKMRTDLHYQHERLRAAVDWQTSAPVLAETVRRLELPLYPPGQAPAAPAPAPAPSARPGFPAASATSTVAILDHRR
jgi:hypothetical protein